MDLYPSSYQVLHFHDDNGNLLSGGTIYAYEAGTTTPAAMYLSDGTQLGTGVTLNARGEPENGSGASIIIWLDSLIEYKFILQSASGTEWTVDDLVAGITQGVIESTVASADPLLWPTASVNVTDSDHDVDFAAGTIANSTGVALLTLAAMTKRLDAAWASGAGAGGLFSGTIAADTTYYCFVIEKDSDGAFDCGFDTSVTAANIPAGYTRYRQIARFKTNASANIISSSVVSVLPIVTQSQYQDDQDALASSSGSALVGYDNTTSGLSATDVQGAIDELDSEKVPVSTLHLNGGSTTQDPNLATEPHILTTHANTPNAVYFWHIDTQFYSSISSSANCRQIAVQYNGGSQMFVRSRYNSVWTGWYRVLTNNDEGSGNGIDADTVDGIQGSSLWHNGNDAHSNSANGYVKLPNGITFQWGSVTFSGASTSVTFPIAFTSVFRGFASHGNSGTPSGTDEACSASGESTTGMTLYKINSSSRKVNWFAIGRI